MNKKYSLVSALFEDTSRDSKRAEEDAAWKQHQGDSDSPEETWEKIKLSDQEKKQRDIESAEDYLDRPQDKANRSITAPGTFPKLSSDEWKKVHKGTIAMEMWEFAIADAA